MAKRRKQKGFLEELFDGLFGESPKKIFISFAIEDKFARNNLVYQIEHQSNVPFKFEDMSLSEPFDYSWKTRCRERIKECDGVIVFISRNTPRAEGARWEIKCAVEEGVPLKGFWVHKDDPSGKPSEMGSRRVVYWTWENVSNFLGSL